MKNVLKTCVITFCTVVFALNAGACHIKKVKNQNNKNIEITIPDEVKSQKDIEILPAMSSKISAKNSIWVGTFQLVWNELIDNIVGEPIDFVEGANETMELLNSRSFSKNDLGDESYYTKWGAVSPDLKKEIEKGIKDKFNETSDILDNFDFTYDPQKLFIYAMLKKDFKFLEAFDKLDDETFGKNETLVKYFGIDNLSSATLYKNVSVLFYNKSNDFAVSIHTKGNDEVILYRTNEDKNFNEYYSDIKTKTAEFEGSQFFSHNDRLKIPNISLYQTTNFSELEGKNIKGKDLRIDKTIETIDFKMDNEGVKLKSEAAIMMLATASPDFQTQIRKFYFNDKFVLFLIEKGKTAPYFALKVNDVDTLNRTGRR